MSKTRIFCTLTGYQLTWLGCAFGEKSFNLPLLGVYIGTIYILLFYFFNKKKIYFLKISLLISIPGYIFDSFMVYFSIYQFNNTLIFGTIPVWMIILWISFSTLFDEILKIFKKYKSFGIFLSAILGPTTYYLAQTIGIISINEMFLFWLIMVIFWMCLMIYYLEIIIKIN